MKAIHVNWTKPYFEKHRLRGHGFESMKEIKSDTYNVPDHQILFTILSILNWKKHNGPIKLYTDSVGASYYHSYYYFDKEKFESEITHTPWIENYNVDDWSPNTSFLCFNNMKMLKEYHEWHKKLVNTNGEKVPEWFWLLTDQGILGHIIRENDYKVSTLTSQIALAHHNTTDGTYRYKGKAEKWYQPVKPDGSKEVDFEHVWLDKINKENLCTKLWFTEIVDDFQSGDVFTKDVRWNKYWVEYHENIDS